MLSELHIKSHPKLCNSSVTSIGCCKLFFLVAGRNAWHSTWINRYTPGSLQASFLGAAATAEKRRVQGTTFVIKELPALKFSSNSGHLLVTEINCRQPLKHYSPDALSNELKQGLEFIDGHQDNYFSVGSPIMGAALSFRPDSRFWRISPPLRNRVLVLGTENKEQDFEQIHLSNALPALWRWPSSSSGSAYKLDWSQIPETTVDPLSVISLSRT